MKVWHGPTGNVVRGHVLDVNVKAFSEALRDLDRQLYVVWNPKKLKGWGCWEIRRKPNLKTMVFKGKHENISIYSLEAVENNFENHILDAAFLNYDAIRKLKSIDTFAQMEKMGVKSYADYLERLEQERQEQIRAKALEERNYMIKQHRHEMKEFKELIRSGMSPAQVLLAVKWAQKS